VIKQQLPFLGDHAIVRAGEHHYMITKGGKAGATSTSGRDQAATPSPVIMQSCARASTIA
jgi:hypothetical protein